MKAKTARRFLSRSAHKIAQEKLAADELLSFCYFNRRKYKKYLVVLRKDQSNVASQRAYQRALRLLGLKRLQQNG